MNKNEYQEALNHISELAEYTRSESSVKPYKDKLQELVDKETPMKLVGDMYHRRCKLCGNQNLNTKWTYGNYCSGCGQKIDWSDEE